MDIFQNHDVDEHCSETIELIAKVEDEERHIRAAVQAQLLKSLRFSSISERLEAIDEAHSQTFQWIFQSPENSSQYAEGRRWDDFPEWLEQKNGLYWVNGKAGSGKSTLMKYAFNNPKTKTYLNTWAGTSKSCVVAFYFWNSGTDQQRSQSGLFRSLLYDTLRQAPELIPVILPAEWAREYSTKCLHSSHVSAYCQTTPVGDSTPPAAWTLAYYLVSKVQLDVGHSKPQHS